MAETIIFRMEIRREYGGFSSASNFISKMKNQQQLCNEEVQGITSVLYKEGNISDNKKIVEFTYKNNNSFHEIGKADRLIEGSKGYQIAYVFYINESQIDDIVELRYYYLMKKYYSNLNLIAIIDGSKNFYFKCSHYFLDVSLKDNLFYNSFFYYDKTFIRLQQNNVPKMKDFVPMQFIDKETIKEWQKEGKKLFNENEIIAYLKNESTNREDSFSVAIQGCLELLGKGFKIVKSIGEKELAKCLLEGNLLSFVLFSYSFYECMKNPRGEKESYTTDKVVGFYRQIQECTVCCEQLIENAVLHSSSGIGVLSIRFHSKTSAYLSQRYNNPQKDIPYLEVLITDYADEKNSKNLASNFVSHIEDEVLRKEFQSLQPVDFLNLNLDKSMREQEIENAFKDYYSISENIGKHFGIKIFSNIIKKNNCIFSFYSHDGHKVKMGEEWGLQNECNNSKFTQCIPGTAYSILFPLESKIQKNVVTRAQAGIDENLRLQENIKCFTEDYECIDKVLRLTDFVYSTQEEKEQLIGKLANQLTQENSVNSKKRVIIYISAEDCSVESAEYLCKALLIAGYREYIPDYVIYNCEKKFVNIFQYSMKVYFALGTMSMAYHEKDFVIALFTREPIEEFIIIPSDLRKTRLANKICGFAGAEISGAEWIEQEELYPELYENREIAIAPFDILHDVKIDRQVKTLFEHYTLQILETDIQEKKLGCKLTHTHMRLGSTIHIDSFYEAELLFNNRMFVSRFAYLLIKGIEGNAEFAQAKCITLYSYALYSELLIFEVINILKELHPEKDFDYAILEREADHRAFAHIDRIRYSTPFLADSEEDIITKRQQHFIDRKIICIVPINSTLKTHEKLIDLFCRDNGSFIQDNIIMNYAVVLVGSEGTNDYWTVDECNRTFTSLKLKIQPVPHYFIMVRTKYQEALGCEMCFPDNPLNETPLIEVNAASTIPNQSFGLYRDVDEKDAITYDFISKEEKSLSVLKKSLIYSHINRGENHFSFYFKTDQFFIENREDIEGWLKGLKKQIRMDEKEYHILVCPSHFSNAGFLESINKIIFNNAALIIRVDIDKEYRCNIEAKFSSVEEFIKLLPRHKKTVIRTYFIDDSIVTGRTFHRAKSLISSVMGVYVNQYANLDIFIFDKIFVLLDRNSSKTRMQYVECVKKGELCLEQQEDCFFAYRFLHISSVRNHGDSCILCQLERQGEVLYETSATYFMAKYWEGEKENFSIKYLERKKSEDELAIKKIDKKGYLDKKKKHDRGYRRMICMHIAAFTLDEKKHGNKKEKALFCILELLLTDYRERKMRSTQGDAFEYFLSYLKVISRPFLAFDKAIREAIFDIIIILTDYLLNNKTQEISYEALRDSKPYIIEAKELFLKVEKEILNDIIIEEQKKDLLLVLMKQSTELRSNYFIRPANIRKFSTFVGFFNAEIGQNIYARYSQFVKKLVGVSSDTSKSAWLNNMLCQPDSQSDQLGLPKDIYTLLVLENTRGYYDGIERLKGIEDITKAKLNEEIKKFQYRDFRKILMDYMWIIEEELSDAGYESLHANIDLLKLTESFMKHDKPAQDYTMSQCRKIVDLMQKSLQAKSVKLILELPLECDLWEGDIKHKFNKWIAEEDLSEQMTLLNIEDKKEYLIVANTDNKNGENNRFSMEQIDVLKEFRINETNDNKDYWIDEKKKFWIWEIEHKYAYSIVFFVEFKEMPYFSTLQIIRNVMSMRHNFRNIFSQETSNHFFELMLSEKERLLYNVSKYDSHSSTDIRNRQYKAIQGKNESEKKSYLECAVLNLLSDLQVSEIYRPSLHKKFYCRKLSIGGLEWDDTAVKINDNSILFVASTGRTSHVKLNVCTNKTILGDDCLLEKSDKLIGFKKACSVSVPFLILFALITNVTVGNRAKREKTNDENEEIEIQVYLTKTKEGDLRILNKCWKKEKTAEQIQKEIEYPPGRDQGISVWSMSRYIKSIVSTLITIRFNIFEEKRANMGKEAIVQELKEQQEMIDELLSQKFQIKVKEQMKKGEEWFYLDIPILAEKYNKYREYFLA